MYAWSEKTIDKTRGERALYFRGQKRMVKTWKTSFFFVLFDF